MNVILDQWTPLFTELESRVNNEGSRKLLFQMIGDVRDVTVLNIGESEIARPEVWPPLKQRYANKYHGGDTTPTLVLTGALKEGFVVEVNSKTATLTNTVPYATAHQFGVAYKNLPPRPFYPVDANGLTFTDYMQSRLNAIVEGHFAV